jgi:hypothetical protein
MAKNATIFEKGESLGEMKAKNKDEFNPQLGNTRYTVERTIYIFSTAKRDFTVSQPLFPGLVLRGCAGENASKRYVLAAKIPDPVPQTSPDLERGGRRIDYHDGWMCAIGLLFPENGRPAQNDETERWSGDWITGGAASAISQGTNLIAQGLFPSLTNPPAESDVLAAEAFRDKRYQRLTDGAFKAAAKSSKALSDYLTEHEDVRDAIEAMGIDGTALGIVKRQVTRLCPNCGDSIPSSVAFHKSSTGILCVLDVERAFKAGAIDRAKMEDLLTSPA